jgi:hypothetical protein
MEKTNSRFPSFPHALRNRWTRFPHSHSSDRDGGGKVEIQNQDFHFPSTTIPLIPNQKTKGARRFAPHLSFRLILQLENAGTFSADMASTPHLFTQVPTFVSFSQRLSIKLPQIGGVEVGASLPSGRPRVIRSPCLQKLTPRCWLMPRGLSGRWI